MPLQVRKKNLPKTEGNDLFTDLLNKIDKEEIEFQNLKQYILDIQQKYKEEWNDHKTNDEKEIEKITNQLKKTKEKLKLEKEKSNQLLKHNHLEKEESRIQTEKILKIHQDLSENYFDLKQQEELVKNELLQMKNKLDEKVNIIHDLEMDIEILEKDMISLQKRNENLEKQLVELNQYKLNNQALNEEIEKIKNDRAGKLKLIENIRLDLNLMDKQKKEISENYSKQINEVLSQKRDLELLVKDLRSRIQKAERKSKCNLL
jgi:chromosome segregation ATPase